MSNFNKVVTNIPVSLTETEMSNLSQTFSGIIQGGGGGEGKRYIGDGVYVTVNNDANPGVISLTQTSLDKLNKEIPSAVSSFQDSVQYAKKTYVDSTFQTKDDMSAYAKKTELPVSITDFADTDTVIYSYINPLTADIQSQINTKQNKLQFDLNAKGEISAIGPLNNTTALAGANGITGDYYSASNPSGFITSSVNELDNFYSKTDTSSKTELQTKFNSLLDYDVVTGNSAVLITTADADNTRTFTISLTATPTAADTVLNGQNGVDATLNGNVWNVGLSQSAYNAVNNVQNKLDTTVAAQTYQPKGDYVSSTDITDMATKTWVGTQGYITVVPSEYVTDTELQTTLADYATKTLVQNTSADIIELIPSTANLATETDLQIVSAGVDYVSAHAITAHQSLTDYYTKSQTSGAIELSTEFGKYALKSEIPTKVSDLTDSANYYKTTETSSKNEITNALNTKVDKPTSTQTGKLVYDGDTSAWVSMPAGTTTIVQGTNGISAEYDNENTYTVGLSASYKAQIEAVSSKLNKTDADTYYAPLSITADVNTLTSASAGWNNKVDKPTSLVNQYLVLRTDSNGDVSGWCDFQDQSYSKAEALRTFVATANIDSTTLSGDGKSVSTKLGVKTDVIATKDYVNSSFLPLSGGTVSGTTIISGNDFNTLEVLRNGQTSTGTIGINGAGGMSLKIADSNSNNTQLNIAPNADMDKRFGIGDNPYSPIAYLIPAVTATSTDGLTNDGILHIILES